MAKHENTIQGIKNRLLVGIESKKIEESTKQQELRNKYATIEYNKIKNKAPIKYNLLTIYRRYYTNSTSPEYYPGTQYIEGLENSSDDKYKKLNSLLKSFNISQFLEDNNGFTLNEYERGIFEHLANSHEKNIEKVNDDLDKLCVKKKKFKLAKKFEELSEALDGIDKKLNGLNLEKTMSIANVEDSLTSINYNNTSFCTKLRNAFGEDLKKSIETNDLNELIIIYDRYTTISYIFNEISSGMNTNYNSKNEKEIKNNLSAAKEILIEHGVCSNAIVEFFENLIKAIEKLLGYDVSREFTSCRINELKKQTQIPNSQLVSAH